MVGIRRLNKIQPVSILSLNVISKNLPWKSQLSHLIVPKTQLSFVPDPRQLCNALSICLEMINDRHFPTIYPSSKQTIHGHPCIQLSNICVSIWAIFFCVLLLPFGLNISAIRKHTHTYIQIGTQNMAIERFSYLPATCQFLHKDHQFIQFYYLHTQCGEFIDGAVVCVFPNQSSCSFYIGSELLFCSRFAGHFLLSSFCLRSARNA